MRLSGLARLCSAVCAVPLLFGAPPPAYAQVGIIGDVPGLTPYQAATATTIDVICPQLVGAGFLGQASPTGDLTDRCTELKGTASQLQREPIALPFSLDLTDQQLATVIGIWSHDQATENSRAAIEIGARQGRAIAGRLSALRLGARGLTASGFFGPGEPSKTVSWSQLLDAESAGGGASADSDLLTRLGVFVNGTYAWGDKQETSREIGFDYDIGGVMAGADYRFTEHLAAGLAFNYTYTSADFQGGRGDTRTNSYGGLLYGTYYRAALYVDAYAGFNWNSYSSNRRIVYGAGPNPGELVEPGFVVNRTATSDPSGQQYSFGVGGGYDIALGPVTLTPLLRTEFIGLHVDGYTERGADGLNLKVAPQKAHSFVTGLGAQLSYAISLPFGVVVPQVRAEWRHEYLNGSRGIRAQFAADPFGLSFAIPTDEPDRDYVAFAAGIASAFRGGWQAFLNYETLLALRNISYNQVTAGVRFEF